MKSSASQLALQVTIVPRARVGYEMIANEACSVELVIIISYPTSASRIIVLLKTIQEISLDLADFVLQKQPEDNLMVAIFRAWNNGSYIMVAKPIKSLELHRTNVQFLLKIDIVYCNNLILIALFHTQTTTFLICFFQFFLFSYIKLRWSTTKK